MIFFHSLSFGRGGGKQWWLHFHTAINEVNIPVSICMMHNFAALISLHGTSICIVFA